MSEEIEDWSNLVPVKIVLNEEDWAWFMENLKEDEDAKEN